MSTMFDLYGLPADFPRIDELRTIGDTTSRAEAAERQIAEACGDDPRLIAYVQRHEFEALVLASLDELQSLLDAPWERRGVETLREELGGQAPEDVDDGRESATAPSRRPACPGCRGRRRSPRPE